MHTIPIHFTFNYAIRFPSGQYYMGPIVVDKKGTRRNDPDNVGPKHHAYTYTENRALVVVAQNQPAFAGCVVERIL